MDIASWDMAHHIHNIVLEATISIVVTIQYTSLTCDEVSTIDN